MTRPKVVIAGAGFGGLTCARALKTAPVDVLIVDRNNHHLFTPLRYQVASALLDPGEIARPVRQVIRPLDSRPPGRACRRRPQRPTAVVFGQLI
jgi:NADH dehydrogenase FAD-containing subunit